MSDIGAFSSIHSKITQKRRISIQTDHLVNNEDQSFIKQGPWDTSLNYSWFLMQRSWKECTLKGKIPWFKLFMRLVAFIHMKFQTWRLKDGQRQIIIYFIFIKICFLNIDCTGHVVIVILIFSFESLLQWVYARNFPCYSFWYMKPNVPDKVG